MSSIFLIFMSINLKNFKNMQNTTLMEFQNLTPMTIPNYYKMMQVDQFLKQTIALGKTNKQAAELLDVSPATINRYKKYVGILSNRKIVNRTTEEKQASMLKSMKTKATNKLIKDEMENIKSFPVDQQLSKIEEFQTKYNISSDKILASSPERLNIQTGSKSTKGKDKKKKNIIAEMNEQLGKRKIENNTSVYSPPLNINKTDTNELYDKSTNEIMSELLTQSATEYKCK